MTYVMSDLHGDYEKFIKMLKLIKFSDDDRLFIAGDICDRGNSSAKIYLEIMERPNVFVIKGNHEQMAETHLEDLIEQYHNDQFEVLDLFSDKNLWLWLENDGGATIESILSEPYEVQQKILNFIKNLDNYAMVVVNGKRYIIVHGGFGKDYKEGKALEEVKINEFLWTRPNFDGLYFDDGNTYIIAGHTPTFKLCPQANEPSIYHGKGNVIAIDCGAAYPEFGGRLGCLCIDTGEEYYI